MGVLLNILLFIIGMVIMFMGLNIGLAGIPTMGWLGSDEFMKVTAADVYAVQDNHIRFIGGVWFAVGLVFFIGGFKRQKIQQSLVGLCLMIGLAALFRLSAMDFDLLFSASIAPSFGFELIGFPLLAYGLVRVTN